MICEKKISDWAITWGDMIIPLRVKLSGTEFSLVSDNAKFDSAQSQTKLNKL